MRANGTRQCKRGAMSDRQMPFSQARSVPRPAVTAQPAPGEGGHQAGGSGGEGEISAGSTVSDWLAPGPGQYEWLAEGAEEVPIESLVVSETPRLSGESL